MIGKSELNGSVVASCFWNPSFFWFMLVIEQSDLNGSAENRSSFWLTPAIGQSELDGSLAASCSWNPFFFWFTQVIGQSELNGSVAASCSWNPSSFCSPQVIGQSELNAGNRAKWAGWECSGILLLKPIFLLVHAGDWTEWIEWECSSLLILKPVFLLVHAGIRTEWIERKCSELVFLLANAGNKAKLTDWEYCICTRLRNSPVYFCSGTKVVLANSESVNMICSFSRIDFQYSTEIQTQRVPIISHAYLTDKKSLISPRWMVSDQRNQNPQDFTWSVSSTPGSEPPNFHELRRRRNQNPRDFTWSIRSTPSLEPPNLHELWSRRGVWLEQATTDIVCWFGTMCVNNKKITFTFH